MLDLGIPRQQLLLLCGDLFLLRNDQRRQRFRIKFLELRKCRALGHRARSMPELFSRARKKHTKTKNQ
jgi:hypothetical protein